MKERPDFRIIASFHFSNGVKLGEDIPTSNAMLRMNDDF
jgi:hypothetical protein